MLRAFLIDADHLLVVGDDPRFECCGSCVLHDQGKSISSSSSMEFRLGATATIAADADQFGPSAKLPYVAGHVARPAKLILFTLDHDHGHRGLG
jgi:hypothetical protein